MHAELTLLVNYLLFSEGLEAIDPAVANTVTELLLLPVENMLWRGILQKVLEFRTLCTYAGYLKKLKVLALAPWAGKVPPRRRTPSSSPTSRCGPNLGRTAAKTNKCQKIQSKKIQACK
jgi:hypothetical protein